MSWVDSRGLQGTLKPPGHLARSVAQPCSSAPVRVAGGSGSGDLLSVPGLSRSVLHIWSNVAPASD